MKLRFVPAALAAFAFAPFADAALENFLPAEGTLLVVKAESVPAVREVFEKDAFFAATQEAILSPMLQEADDDDDAFAAVRSTLNLLWERLGGEAVAATVDLPVAQPGGEIRSAAVLLAEVAKDFPVETAEAILRRLNAEEIFSETELAGVPARRVPAGVFAVADGLFLFSTDEGVAEKILRAAKSGGNAEGIDSRAAFREVRKRAKAMNADVWAYADGLNFSKRVFPETAPAPAGTAGSQAGTEVRLFGFPLVAEPAKAAFALDALDACWLGISRGDDGVCRAEMTLLWNRKSGVVRLITDALVNGYKEPKIFPARNDMTGFGCGNYSFGAATVRLLEILRSASPIFGLVDIQFMLLKAGQNLDVPAAIANVHGGGGYYSCRYRGEETSVLLLDLVDGKSAVSALAKLSALDPGTLAPADAASFGKNVSAAYTLNFDGSLLTAVVLEDMMLIGNEDAVRLLTSPENPRAGTVWNDANFRAGEALLPPGGCGIAYVHISRALSAAWEKLADRTTPGSTVANLKSLRDAIDYSFVSKFYVGDREMTARAVLFKNKN